MNVEELNLNITARFQSLQETLQEVLKQLFNQDFNLDMELQEGVTPNDGLTQASFPTVCATFNTEGSYEAQHMFMLPPALIAQAYAWMVGGEPTEEISDEQLEGLREGSDQILGQVRAGLDGEGISLKVGDVQFIQVADAESSGLNLTDKQGSVARYTITVGESSYSVEHFVMVALGEGAEESAESSAEPEKEIENLDDLLDDSDFMDQITEEEEAEKSEPEVDIRNVEFGEFPTGSESNGNGKPRNIDMLMDVELDVLVELGRKNMFIRDVLKLGKGSVVELDKAAGEPLSIFVNGRKLAEGEVVVVDDHFGIRITQLAGPAERIRSLG